METVRAQWVQVARGQRTARQNRAIWYHGAESEVREKMPPPRRDKAALEALFIELMAEHHVPHADDAYITLMSSPDHTQSMIGWDTEVGFTPIIKMDPAMQDELTVLHESAHHIHIVQNGLKPPRPYSTMDASHNEEWARIFIGLCRQHLPQYAGPLDHAFNEADSVFGKTWDYIHEYTDDPKGHRSR